MPRIVFLLAALSDHRQSLWYHLLTRRISWRYISSDNVCTASTVVVVVWLYSGQSWLCSLAVHGPSMALRAGSNSHNYLILLPFPPRETQELMKSQTFFSWPCLWQCTSSLISHYHVHEGEKMEASLYAEPGTREKTWFPISEGLMMTH